MDRLKGLIVLLRQCCQKNASLILQLIGTNINRSTGFSPSSLLFGINQKGKVYDKFAEYIQQQVQENKEEVDLLEKRRQADDNIKKSQSYNKDYYDKVHKRPYVYNRGDYVLLKNNPSLPGVNKKLFAKYRGPYEIERALDNDRYIVKDLDGMQITRIPYRGICSPVNMKPFVIDSEFSFEKQDVKS